MVLVDIVIEFFRDTLDGPLYIVWVIICVVLIFACIGYLADKGIKNKKEKEKYATVNQDPTAVNGQAVVVSDPNVVPVQGATVSMPTSGVTLSSIPETVAPVQNQGVVSQAVVSQPVSVPVTAPQNVATPVGEVVNTASIPVVNEAVVAQPVNTTTTVAMPNVGMQPVQPVNTVVNQPTPVTNVVNPNVGVVPNMAQQVQTSNVIPQVVNTNANANNVVIPTTNQNGNNNAV